jgi:serine protease Do
MKLLSNFLAIFMAITTSAFAAEVPPSFADLVEKLTPAVVNISTTQKMKSGAPGLQMFQMPEEGQMPEEFRDFFDQFMKQGQNGQGQDGKQVEREVYSLGSGFIIDENGYIATNNHVIADAEEITVILSDDTKLKAKIIGRDTKTDLALLKVEAGKKLPAVSFGDSDASRVGDWVIAIGNPYGLGGTVTAGIISARARNINAGPFDDFIQTDAAINRGNSGGPLFNVKGEVIGINTAIFSPSGGSIGIGFAVPVSMAKSVFTQLRTNGRIDRAWLGVKIQHVTDEIADSVGLKKTMGALVMDVTKDSPSAKAGVEVGDVITKFDGKEVKEMRFLPRMVADTKIGKTVAVELWRKGQPKNVSVILAQLKEQDEAALIEKDEEGGTQEAQIKTKELLGMSLSPITSSIRDKFKVAPDTKGVIVTKIKPGSEAGKRGLQAGDVITQIGDNNIQDTKNISDAIQTAHAAGHKFILVRVLHGKESVFVTLPIEEKK